jgi:hypothetical protein
MRHEKRYGDGLIIKILGIVVWIASKIRIATGLNEHGFNPLNAELNPICHLLALLGGTTIVDVGKLRVKHSASCTQGIGKRQGWVLHPLAFVQNHIPNIWNSRTTRAAHPAVRNFSLSTCDRSSFLVTKCIEHFMILCIRCVCVSCLIFWVGWRALLFVFVQGKFHVPGVDSGS